MADYYGTARSNYVRFDYDKLNALVTLFNIEIPEGPDDDFYCIISQDEGGTPSHFFDGEDEEAVAAVKTLDLDPDTYSYVEFLDVVHLAFAEDPGGLFVWIEVGNEKARYLHGSATAIDATGEIVNQIDLTDIYETEDVNSHAEY